MPTVDENLVKWGDYDWKNRGDEWSLPWGDAAFQWAITIYPRLMRILPAHRLIEIAPGFGRWVPFLLGQSQSYIGIDISPSCIDYCRRTYSRLPQRPRFLVGEGTSLAGVEDSTIDLVFSFDSLVHVELNCIAAYAKDIARVLCPGGYAFLHHSNIGEYESSDVINVGWRGAVSADSAGREFVEAGLRVLTQEKTPWVFGGVLTDCFSLLRKPGHGEAPGLGRQFTTGDFELEYKIAARMALGSDIRL